ncbi:hypothetical protein EON83_23020 [bacterium]|nr:MAG: hypothetical protein EON83_23020 [bacterium]
MKRHYTRATSVLLLAPLLFIALVGAIWWRVRRPSISAAPYRKLIDVPIAPQLSGDGRLITAGIQMLERFDVTNADGNGNGGYVDQMVGFEARFWDAQSLDPLPSLPLTSTPGELALSPDGSLLALNESGNGFRVVDLTTRKTLWSRSEAESVHAQPTEPGMIVSLAPHGLSHPVFSPDGSTLALWEVFIDTENSTTHVTGFLFDARTGARKASWKGSPGSRLNDPKLAFSPQGRFLASDEIQPQVYLSNVPYARPEIRRANDGKLLRTLPFSRARIAAFGAENRLLVLINSTQYGTDVLEVDATTGKRIWSHTGTVKRDNGAGPLTTIESAFYSSDKKWIALGFRGARDIEILDAQSGKLVQLLQVPAAPGSPYTDDGAFAFSPDGTAILAMNQGTITKLKINTLPNE